jgi:hypothetical protein
MLWQVRRGGLSPSYYAPVEVVGLDWSFLDVYAPIVQFGIAATQRG